MTSYESILENMIATYFDQCGEYPDMDGEAGVRLKVFATELCSLSAQCDFVLKQSSYKTATGEYLDRITNQCGINRHQGTKATGKLTFSVLEPLDTDVTVPVGTVCSKGGKPYIQYITTQSGVIAAGQQSCEVEAEALSVGEDHNAAGLEITTMINPPSGVDFVTNHQRFSGGWSRENDEMLRARLERALDFANNGVNLGTAQAQIENLDRVRDCFIEKVGDGYDVWIETYNGILDDETRNSADDILGFLHLYEIEYSIRNRVD